jgi:hypothetical protein
MNERKIFPSFSHLDWKWVGVGYCFFVVFHRLTGLVIFQISRSMNTIDLGFLLWYVVGLALVAFYIGFKSRGVTIIEPALSSILYLLTLALEFKSQWGLPIQKAVGGFLLWLVVSITITIVSAWLGEIYQARRQATISERV